MDHRELVDTSLDALNFGLMVVDDQGYLVRINQWAAQLLDLKPGPHLQLRLAEVLPAADPLAEACVESGIRQKGRIPIEGFADLNLGVSPLWEAGRAVGAVLSLRPNQAPNDLPDHLGNTLDSRELNAIFDISSDGILLCDGKGVIIKINDASVKLNGFSASEVVGKTVQDLLKAKLINGSVTLEVLKTGKQVNMMQYITRTQKHLLVTGTPVFDQNGDISLVVVNERDLTQLNSIQLQLEETKKMSEKYRDELAEMVLLKSQVGDIISGSPATTQVLKYALKLAKLDTCNALLLGESGTGKGLLAEFIHQNSNRRGPLIQINCAALPEHLLEAELFGYEKGAFTGARNTGKAGLFELAQYGTLFLDEIGDCPVAIQAKLLKYLDDHKVMRLGSVKSRIIECNIIAATNQDLEKLIEKGAFRSDLFYRLSAFTIQIPPLRERPEDIFELILHFLEVFNSRYGLKRKLSSKALRSLQSYPFWGNVRELKNIIKQAVVMSDNDVLDDFILEGLDEKQNLPPSTEPARLSGEGLEQQIMRFERELFKKVLPSCRSTRELADLLGTSQPTVVRRLKKYGLEPPSKQN